MSAHTPGPWTLETVSTSCGVCHKVGPFPYRNGKSNHACIYADYPSNGPFDVELQANARLIAAAPCLLAVCKAAIAALSQPMTYPADISAAKKWLGDAVAKAEGN